MSDILLRIVEKQKAGIPAGIVSVCTSNGYAIKSAMKHAMEYDVPVLLEATANQVDQAGGYTGMKPVDFIAFIHNIAQEINFPVKRIILGGDHLGPLTRKHLDEKEAMEYAEVLVSEYVSAGFSKIHLDTSMKLGSDPAGEALHISTVAERGARLCIAAEAAFKQRSEKYPAETPPFYIIGSEVPIPGGAQDPEEGADVTSPEHCRETFETYKQVFSKHNLDDAFKRVIALVVQTGAEFGDTDIYPYSSEKARSLTEYGRKNLPFVFEGHSTDYQTEDSLKAMVKDGIAFLKVGPALTFALREALFMLEMIEQEVYYGTSWDASNFRDVLELAMLNNPGYWKNHYHGDARKQYFSRKFSFSDRARYFLNDPEVEKAVNCLVRNINNFEIPISLLSQYMPREMYEFAKNKRDLKAEDLIDMHIGFYLDNYYKAILPDELR